jgi:chemotaxis protein methyltransferase CheR
MMTVHRSDAGFVSPIAAAPARWSDPAFARVAEAVYLVAGLVFPANRQASAEWGMRRAMSALHLPDPESLARAVQGPGEARDVVLAELTVGETYFFREAGQLEVIRTEVLPMMAPRCGPDRPLRLWSAGCASGEEPYTLAIMLRELGWPHPVHILGTDVSRPRLDAARRGRYTRWSLRGVSTPRIERWFERHGPHFRLHETIRDAADFRPLNLVGDEYPSAASATRETDVILCRNVLIYFDLPTIAHIATRLLASLAPDGWLLLGASDPPLNALVPCEVVFTAGGVAYRRADRDPARGGSPVIVPRGDGPSASWSAVGRAPIPPPDEPDDDRSIVDPAPVLRAVAADGGAHDEKDLGSWIVLVRTVANRGRLREAEERCARALDLHRLSPELHYLHATLLSAAGQHREAANAARRALYLDRHYVMAHLQLGDALVHAGDAARAARAFENVVAALAGVGDEQPVPGADGVPASRLRHVAAQWLRALGAERAS